MSERSINRVQLMGRLGNDVEVKYTPSGTQVGTFNLATTRRWKDQQSSEWKEATDWHRVVFWRVDKLAQYLIKGKRVMVDGRLSTRSYEAKGGDKRYVTEVICEDIYLLSSAPPPAQSDPYSGMGVTDDDVPF